MNSVKVIERKLYCLHFVLRKLVNTSFFFLLRNFRTILKFREHRKLVNTSFFFLLRNFRTNNCHWKRMSVWTHPAIVQAACLVFLLLVISVIQELRPCQNPAHFFGRRARFSLADPRGRQGYALPRVQFSFIFMQFWSEIGKNIMLAPPPLWLAPPTLGNPRSTTCS